MTKAAQIVAAIEDIAAAQSPLPLTKKPNVSDVEVYTEFDITAAERNEAWELFLTGEVVVDTPTLEKEADTVDEVTETVEEAEEAEEVEEVILGAHVTNLYTSTIALFGVNIPVGQSADVPRYNPNHKVMGWWLEKGVIEVS